MPATTPQDRPLSPPAMKQPRSRIFTDSVGTPWTVHLVQPVLLSEKTDSWLHRMAPPIASAQHERRRPWLVFESAEGEKRRLVPVPDEWDSCTDFEIERWCMRAVPVPPGHARREEDR